MEKITDKNMCYGCTACYSLCPQNAISMKEDNRGFKYPSINNEKCINCELCKNICPANKSLKKFLNENTFTKIFAAKTKNENIRKKSTSGGMFSEISNYVLENNGIIYGTILDNNFQVKYICVDNTKDRDLMRGAKYVQSNLNDTFINIKKDLKSNKLVLFIGNPCFVAGLKSFLGFKNHDNLVLCDIVCHGVPSPLIFKEHVNYIRSKHSLKKYIFRNKLIGWRGTNTTIEYDNKVEYNTSYSDIFTNLYFDGYISRDCCSSCKYTSMNRVSDITIGDFWGIEKSHPSFNDERGTSLVIINTIKGEKVFNKIKDNLLYINSSPEKCVQPQLQYPSKENIKKERFWLDYESKGFEYIAKKYTVYGLKNKIIRHIKNLIPNSIKSKLK